MVSSKALLTKLFSTSARLKFNSILSKLSQASSRGFDNCFTFEDISTELVKEL